LNEKRVKIIEFFGHDAVSDLQSNKAIKI
jgi:hypothetical protein